jgi:hypothetical protein
MMRILRNLTLHYQEAECVGLAARHGFALQREPEGVEARCTVNGVAEASMVLAQRLAECSRDGVAALIGGHTAIWIAALDRLAAAGIRRPDLCYFETRRERDEDGRFVFKPGDLRLLCHPSFACKNRSGTPH